MFARVLLGGIFLLALPVALASCGPATQRSQAVAAQTQSHGRALVTVSSLYIAPVQIDRSIDPHALGAIDLNQEIASAAREQSDLRPIENERNIKSSSTTGAQADQRAALDIGQKLGADAVLITSVTSYAERVGSAVGASSPARVDFVMSVVRAHDRANLWQYSFHFADKAVSDNLLAIGRSGKDAHDRQQRGADLAWQSARDVVREGFRDAFRDLSAQRQAQFSRAG